MQRPSFSQDLGAWQGKGWLWGPLTFSRRGRVICWVTAARWQAWVLCGGRRDRTFLLLWPKQVERWEMASSFNPLGPQPGPQGQNLCPSFATCWPWAASSSSGLKTSWIPGRPHPPSSTVPFAMGVPSTTSPPCASRDNSGRRNSRHPKGVPRILSNRK